MARSRGITPIERQVTCTCTAQTSEDGRDLDDSLGDLLNLTKHARAKSISFTQPKHPSALLPSVLARADLSRIASKSQHEQGDQEIADIGPSGSTPSSPSRQYAAHPARGSPVVSRTSSLAACRDTAAAASSSADGDDHHQDLHGLCHRSSHHRNGGIIRHASGTVSSYSADTEHKAWLRASNAGSAGDSRCDEETTWPYYSPAISILPGSCPGVGYLNKWEASPLYCQSRGPLSSRQVHLLSNAALRGGRLDERSTSRRRRSCTDVLAAAAAAEQLGVFTTDIGEAADDVRSRQTEQAATCTRRLGRLGSLPNQSNNVRGTVACISSTPPASKAISADALSPMPNCHRPSTAQVQLASSPCSNCTLGDGAHPGVRRTLMQAGGGWTSGGTPGTPETRSASMVVLPPLKVLPAGVGRPVHVAQQSTSAECVDLAAVRAAAEATSSKAAATTMAGGGARSAPIAVTGGASEPRLTKFVSRLASKLNIRKFIQG